jgi:hypothetical protein
MMETRIYNTFTGYDTTIKTKNKPSISTLEKHLRKSKAKECGSITYILIDGVRHFIADVGRGKELFSE